MFGGFGTKHPRARNGRPGYALTWHEYGEWFALLFDIDPDAWISGWDGRKRFHEATHRQFVRYSRLGVPEGEPTAVTSKAFHACPTRNMTLAFNS